MEKAPDTFCREQYSGEWVFEVMGDYFENFIFFTIGFFEGRIESQELSHDTFTFFKTCMLGGEFPFVIESLGELSFSAR